MPSKTEVITRGQFKKQVIGELLTRLDKSEAEGVFRILAEDVLQLEPVDFVVGSDVKVEPETVTRINAAVRRILQGEPVQYVVGSALFHGLRFNVGPGVLIPRPETSGLVDIISDEWANVKDLNMLDVCTGSGAIALALAKALPFCSVVGLDISSEALKYARENSENLHVKNVKFQQTDVLKEPFPAEKFDIVVSNPPYVTNSEKKEMDKTVLDYEPSLALFVPDDDALLFYRRIAAEAFRCLKEGGGVYFEINPVKATEVKKMLVDNGFSDVAILKDYRGRDRYTVGKK